MGRRIGWQGNYRCGDICRGVSFIVIGRLAGSCTDGVETRAGVTVSDWREPYLTNVVQLLLTCIRRCSPRLKKENKNLLIKYKRSKIPFTARIPSFSKFCQIRNVLLFMSVTFIGLLITHYYLPQICIICNTSIVFSRTSHPMNKTEPFWHGIRTSFSSGSRNVSEGAGAMTYEGFGSRGSHLLTTVLTALPPPAWTRYCRSSLIKLGSYYHSWGSLSNLT